MTIPVIWYNSPDGRWRKNCTAMLNDMLDRYECAHIVRSIPTTMDFAVVVVHGESCIGMEHRLNLDLQMLGAVVLIYLGDECHQFDINQIKHPNMVVWIQEPVPGLHNPDRVQLDGWTPGCKWQDVERDLDWFFAGQVTHERRQACAEALRSMTWGGFIIETKGYTQGVSLPEYWRCLSRAKFVPCPSGPNSPDAARAWEALECGAVPILDAKSPMIDNCDFWPMALGEHPLPVLRSWESLSAFLSFELPNWEQWQAKTQIWWNNYKKDYFDWLRIDMEKLDR
jgi:hypothetical protein